MSLIKQNLIQISRFFITQFLSKCYRYDIFQTYKRRSTIAADSSWVINPVPSYSQVNVSNILKARQNSLQEHCPKAEIFTRLLCCDINKMNLRLSKRSANHYGFIKIRSKICNYKCRQINDILIQFISGTNIQCSKRTKNHCDIGTIAQSKRSIQA